MDEDTKVTASGSDTSHSLELIIPQERDDNESSDSSPTPTQESADTAHIIEVSCTEHEALEPAEQPIFKELTTCQTTELLHKTLNDTRTSYKHTVLPKVSRHFESKPGASSTTISQFSLYITPNHKVISMPSELCNCLFGYPIGLGSAMAQKRSRMTIF